MPRSRGAQSGRAAVALLLLLLLLLSCCSPWAPPPHRRPLGFAALFDALPVGGIVATTEFQRCQVCTRRWPPGLLREADSCGGGEQPATRECAYCAGGFALELASEPQKIVLIDGDDKEEELQDLSADLECATVVAFDAEWEQRKARIPIAVLQLAFPESGNVYVIHRSSCRGLPRGVRRMLQDEGVVKVGWGCTENDLHRLRSCKYETRSVRDIQKECAKLLLVETLGLSTAALDLLGYDMWKDKSVARSDWTRPKLTKEQVYYAAMDAWVTLRLFLKVQAVMRAKHLAGGASAL